MLKNFKGKKVLIMGLGLLGGGVGAARFFAKTGSKVTVTDLRTKRELLPSIRKLKGFKIKFTLGKHVKEDFENADFVIRNPDVLFDSPYLKYAKTVKMLESFFAKNYPGKIIGITGTRGKSTTASLIYHILRQAKFNVHLAGNINESYTLDLLDSRIKNNSIVVLELSSFQLHGFGEAKISPTISVITNIYPEHLNHYKNFKDYIDDKKNIFRYQSKNDLLILNKDDKYKNEFKKEAKSKVLFFSKNDIPANWKLRLSGDHNRENVAAAIKVVKIFGIDELSIKKALANFKSLPYHLEEVKKINGVRIINDGISTSPEATIAALNCFKKPILLLGGNDKNLDFTNLGKVIDRKVKLVFLMQGTATKKIKKAIGRKNLIYGEFNILKDTIRASLNFAKQGDIILFSPAATSFNWYGNVYERCKDFENQVKKL